jgi:hypothetical protein
MLDTLYIYKECITEYSHGNVKVTSEMRLTARCLECGWYVRLGVCWVNELSSVIRDLIVFNNCFSNITFFNFLFTNFKCLALYVICGQTATNNHFVHV